MRIAFCLGSLNKGGAERVVCNLANYLAKKNYEVHIIVTKLNKIEYELEENVTIVSLDNRKKTKIGLISRNIRIIKELKKYLLNERIDIVLGFLQEPTARLLFLKTFDNKIRKIPLIVSLRIDPKHAFNSIKRKLVLPLYNYSNGFVFQTKEAQLFFNKEIKNRSVIIPNSLNSEFCKINEEKKIEKKIVSVGRLTKQKNYPMLIKGFKSIEKELSEYVLEIYGDGELKKDLTELIKELQLENKVYLKGNVPNLKDKIENASLFVMTSDYEGLSNALMEAMSLGLPCISTDSDGGGAKELIIDDYNGILIKKNDVSMLSEKILKVLSNKDFANQISKNAVKSMDKYKPEIINKKWENYITIIANGGKLCSKQEK